MNRRFEFLPRLSALAILAGPRTSVCAAFSLLVGFATPAAAAWPSDPNNGNVALCTSTGDQYYPAIVSDGSGGVIVAWSDTRSGTSAIYAQRVSVAGVPQWTPNGVALCTGTDGVSPTIVSDGAGGAIVTWEDFRSGIRDIYAQRVSPGGAPLWTANGVAMCTAPDYQRWPMIVSDGAGGAIVTWYDFRSGTSYDIYAQRVSAAGVAQWTADGVALCTATDDQFSPTIASDGMGGAIVTWHDERIDGYYTHIYAQRVNAAGVPQWTTNGVALCTAPLEQGYPTIVSDGAGGAIVTWYDWRGAGYDIYAQRVNAAGVPQWTANGVALCTATDSQFDPKIASDGSGGAIVTWHDFRNSGGNIYASDVYAQRVSAAGVPQWTVNGVALCTATGSQPLPTIASDGLGGAIVTWRDNRGGFNDIYAQRLSAAGVPQWTANGVALCAATNDQINPAIVSDGSGGAIVAWQDARNGNYDIYAQRIDRSGLLGPEPTIASVRDVPNDQGKQVRIVFGRSRLDYAGSPIPITGYQLYRRAVVVGTALPPARPPGATGGSKIDLLGWDYLMNVPARGDSFYQAVVATIVDSSSTGIHRAAFFVSAITATPTTYFDSAPDSGHSVDNIPPVPPAPFTAAYASGATHLHWGANTEPDFWHYKLYRGNSSGFTPGPGNQIASQSDTGYVDAGPAGGYYKVSAVDVDGNESGYSLVTPGTTLDVKSTVPGAVFLGVPSPNPARASATLRFGLPREAAVSLRIYDVHGRLVRELAAGKFTAGDHDLAWDLRNDSGERVNGAIFFATLTTNEITLSRRFAVVR